MQVFGQTVQTTLMMQQSVINRLIANHHRTEPRIAAGTEEDAISVRESEPQDDQNLLAFGESNSNGNDNGNDDDDTGNQATNAEASGNIEMTEGQGDDDNKEDKENQGDSHNLS